MSDSLELRDTPRTRGTTCNGLDTTKNSEQWCWVCGARVTLSREQSLEYGHMQSCPRRPDEFTNRVGDNSLIWSRERIKAEANK